MVWQLTDRDMYRGATSFTYRLDFNRSLPRDEPEKLLARLALDDGRRKCLRDRHNPTPCLRDRQAFTC